MSGVNIQIVLSRVCGIEAAIFVEVTMVFPITLSTCRASALQYLHCGREDILVVVLQIVQFLLVSIEQRRRIRHISHFNDSVKYSGGDNDDDGCARCSIPGSAPLTTITPTSTIVIGDR